MAKSTFGIPGDRDRVPHDRAREESNRCARLQNCLALVTGGRYSLYLVGSRMFRRGSTPVRLLVAVAASVFLLGIVATELPELLTLSDNTSNDFAMRKAGTAEFASMLSTANHTLLPLNMKGPEYGADIRWAPALEDPKPATSDLFCLHSVLRT